MQHLSSKKYEHLMHASELFDRQCRQEAEGDRELLSSPEVKQHMERWAIIGSALRQELPAKLDLNFASKVMARIEVESMQDDELPSMLRSKSAFAKGLEHANDLKTQDTVFDQSQLNEPSEQKLETKTRDLSSLRHIFNFKRLSVVGAQVAIAATVAVVSVVGLQTYHASDPSVDVPAVSLQSNNSGPVSGLILASYQNSDNEMLMNMEQMPAPNFAGNQAYESNIKQKQKEELERINRYVQGYVLETAFNKQ